MRMQRAKRAAVVIFCEKNNCSCFSEKRITATALVAWIAFLVQVYIGLFPSF